VYVPSVAAGVDHLKHSRLTEAMQMFNKALQIDADNVEALVARGALYVPHSLAVKKVAHTRLPSAGFWS